MMHRLRLLWSAPGFMVAIYRVQRRECAMTRPEAALFAGRVFLKVMRSNPWIREGYR